MENTCKIETTQKFKWKFLLPLILPFCFLVACSQSSFDAEMANSPLEDVPSAAMSKVIISSPNVADGMSPAEVRLLLRNARGAAIRGLKLKLRVSGSENVVVPCSESDHNGNSSCKIYSTLAEAKVVSLDGFSELKAPAVFDKVKPFRSSVGITSSGSTERLTTGHRITSASGIATSPIAQRDNASNIRLQSSILGAALSN